MSLKYLIKEETLKNMANTIRSKMGTTEPMNTVEMVEAIANIPSSTEMTNATATEDKVLNGYTFYAGEGGLKTGGMTAASLGITPESLVAGNTVLGVTGVASDMIKIASTIGGRTGHNGDYYQESPQTVSVSVPAGYEKLVIVASSISMNSWYPSVTISSTSGTITELQSDTSTAFQGLNGGTMGAGITFKTAILTGASNGCTVSATGGGGANCAGVSVFALM